MTRLLLAMVETRDGVPGVLVAGMLVFGLLWRADADARLRGRVRAWSDLAIICLTLGAMLLTAVDAIAAVKWYRSWDFPSFYTVAYAAVHGQTFYDPQVLAQVQGELQRAQGVPSEWLKEVGYWYLPPSLFYILPLGFFAYRAAMLVHFAVQGVLLLGSALLLHRIRPLARGGIGLAMMVLLLLLFRPVQATVFFAQIVFGALFFLVLAERSMVRSAVATGLSLALGFFYKHLLLIPGLLLLASPRRRHVGAGLVMLAGIGVALALSVLAFGGDVFRLYAANGPGARSEELAVDPVVQSLLALLYRALGVTPHGSLLQIILFKPFLVVAGAMALLTVAALWLRGRNAERESFWLISALAITCYPHTLLSTLALIFPAMLGVFQSARGRGVGLAPVAGFISGLYLLAGLLPVQAGWSAALVWLALLPLTLRSRRAEVASAT